jgi:hypothetical protein
LEETQCYLLYAETAKDLQGKDDLGFAWDARVGTDEEHPELVIPHLVFEVDPLLCAHIIGDLFGCVVD